MSETQTQEHEGTTAPPPEVDPEVEARARRMGWKPQSEYRGPPEMWHDAKEYIELGEVALPVMAARNKKLDRQVERLESRLGEQSTLLTDIVHRSRKVEELAYNRAKAELEAERRAAVASGDTETFERADRQMQLLTPPAPAPEPAKPPTNGNGADPVIQAWRNENPWFDRDQEANVVAVGIHGMLSQQHQDWSLEEKLAETKIRMKRLRPDLFESASREADQQNNNERRRAPPAVSASSTAGGRAVQPRSFDALPADARAQFPRVVKMLEGKGEPYTKEEHARLYWAQFPDDGA